MLISFLFLHENIHCGYSLEAPRRGASNEYPQHMFSWRNKKNNMWIPPLICSYEHLTEALLRSTNSILCFHGEIRKILFGYLLLSGSMLGHLNFLPTNSLKFEQEAHGPQLAHLSEPPLQICRWHATFFQYSYDKAMA